MKVTDEQRSKIASALIGGIVDPPGLCCCHDGQAVCARIVGRHAAYLLRTFFYEHLGCHSKSADAEQEYLDRIASLEDL